MKISNRLNSKIFSIILSIFALVITHTSVGMLLPMTTGQKKRALRLQQIRQELARKKIEKEFIEDCQQLRSPQILEKIKSGFIVGESLGQCLTEACDNDEYFKTFRDTPQTELLRCLNDTKRDISDASSNDKKHEIAASTIKYLQCGLSDRLDWFTEQANNYELEKKETADRARLMDNS